LIDETSIPFSSAASLRVSRTLTIRARKKLAPMVVVRKMFVYRHVVTGDTLPVGTSHFSPREYSICGVVICQGPVPESVGQFRDHRA
jgi:hypothetical protein